MKRNSILGIILLGVALTACNSDRTYTSRKADGISVTDAKGNTITLEKPAERIVCLFDPAVDDIYMLRMQHKLVGVPVETYTDAELFEPYRRIDARIQQKSIATPGSNETANTESIIQLKPDLVIVQHMPAGAVNALAQMNIPVYQAAAETYNDVVKELGDIATLTGSRPRGDSLLVFADRLLKKLQQQPVHSGGANKKAYFTWANGRIFSTTGTSSNMHYILTLAGVDNVCTTSIDQPNINPETLVAWNPDMIVMWNDSPDLFYDRPELKGINAIGKKQIYNLMPMFFYNPHTLKSLCAATLIHQWAYGSKNDEENLAIREMIVQLYGEENGTQLLKLLP